MNGYVCVRCGSDDLALHSAIWKQGYSEVRQQTESSGTYTTAHGNFGYTSATHETTGSTQTALAAECAPPASPGNGAGLPLLGLVAAPAALCYWILGFKWKWDSFDKLVLWAGVIAVGLNIVWELMVFFVYAPRCARAWILYQRKCVCLSCGTHSLLPEGWDEQQDAPEPTPEPPPRRRRRKSRS